MGVERSVRARVARLTLAYPPLMSASGILVPEPAHILGPADAPVTLVEFGDFGCPFCAASRMPIEGLVKRLERVRLVWRHFPDPELHPGADLAAEASEAAAAEDAFWPMHEALLGRGGAFDIAGLTRQAAELGLDVERFGAALHERRFRGSVEADVAAGREHGVTGTPTFFIDGERVNAHWTELRNLLPAAVAEAESG
jgi:protein-disulfide isomerase